MSSFLSIKKIIRKPFESRTRTITPEKAYDIWAEDYDTQPNNLILALEEQLFSVMLQNISLQNKVIVDVGCGTGRHWEKIYGENPKHLLGFDVSDNMLAILKSKFPGAITYKLFDNQLYVLSQQFCDLLISTLTVAHIDKIEEAFKEWNRVLKPGAGLLITDYHPEALSRGASRTFRHREKLIAVKSHIYPLRDIISIAACWGFSMTRFSERRIDESVEHYYINQNADHLYRHFFGTPIIYGIHFRKNYVAS